MIVRSNTFIKNNALYAGGAIHTQYSNLTVTDSVFEQNNGTDFGGAISTIFVNMIVMNSIFKSNAANYGGALDTFTSDLTLADCVFEQNSAITYGGAIRSDNDDSNVINSTFISNAAEYGGAQCINNLASNVIISGNYINNSAVNGSAVYFRGSAENVSISGKFIDNQGVNALYINQSISGNIIHDSIFIDNEGIDIFVNSDEARVVDTWFGNNATNYGDKPAAVNVDMTNWLFLNATVDPNISVLNKNSTITFKLYSYNETSKEINEYDASKMNITLELSQTFGELNQTNALIGEDVAFTAKSGNATVTGKFESAYYTLGIRFTSVNGADIVKMYKNATQYYAAFFDTEGKFLANGTKVKFKINGVTYERRVSGDKGLAKLNINLEQGEYVIIAMNLVTGENATNNVTVIPNIVENNDLTKYYKNATQYTVKILGDDGNPVGAGKDVVFNVNGILYTRQTNASGIAKLNINLPPGDYIITAEYNGCKVSNNITVLPVLSASDLIKKYGSPDQFVATLVDGQGKAFAGENVTFNVNGILYNRVTGGNGQAKLNINLMPGQYIITSSYNGSAISNKITVNG